MTKKLGRLLDPYTGLMECKMCGIQWGARLQGGGKYHRGSWQCPNGCRFEDESAKEGVSIKRP